ncbi:MAG TPA: CRISPR-associated protein Csx15 [Roseiflexaceae bacterium]
MLLLNFSHPLTNEQMTKITILLGERPNVQEISSQVERLRPLTEAVIELVESLGLTPIEWQTLQLIINPPALAPVALTLMAELHGRCGYFPSILNIRPVPGALPPRFEVAEIVNLQALRDAARARRQTTTSKEPGTEKR